jgi:hypothetical protein
MISFKDFILESNIGVVEYDPGLTWNPDAWENSDAEFMITSALSEEGSEKWVSVQDKNIVAAASYYITRNGSMQIEWFGSVVKGAGSPLMRSLIQEAKAKGCKRIELTSTIDGDAFYLHHGFKMMNDGDQNSLVYMVKHL